MEIVFTICSLNYLSGAKALAESISNTNPHIKFVFLIADKINNRLDYSHFDGHDIAEVHELQINNLQELIDTYNIIEFNTAIKPFAFKYLSDKYQTNKIIYLDPDILVFGSLERYFELLSEYDFIVTPHILNPIVDDRFYNQQKGALNTGIFNLGFLAMNINDGSTPILEWWQKHMRNHGHSKSAEGEFYDQKIMNLLPIHSNKVLIDKHPGANVAGWNIHERRITKEQNNYLVNKLPLIFFHYSGLPKEKDSVFISGYNNYLLSEAGLFCSELIKHYRYRTEKNNIYKYEKIKCYYKLKPNIHRASRFEIYKYKLGKWLK
jgi:lipopolysaccharide biosynthesis glycosyltransferase